MQKIFYSMIGVIFVIASARQVVANIASGDPRTTSIAVVVALAIALYVAVRSGFARVAFRALVGWAAWKVVRRR